GMLREVPFDRLRADQPHVPTLDEALDELAGLLVNIEMKCLPWEADADTDGAVAALVVAAVDTRDLREQVVGSSFDLGRLGSVGAIDARIPLGWLTSRQAVDQTVPQAIQRGMGWLHPDRGVMVDDPIAAVTLAHDRGLRVDVWTVNETDDVRALAAAGVDAI